MPSSDVGISRYEELDSIRGLAALSVSLGHIYTVILMYNLLQGNARLFSWFAHTPLYIFLAGPEAVIMFFVLSGFVLSLPWVRGGVLPFWKFATRRIFRIYIPYLVSLIIAIWLRLHFSGVHDPELRRLVSATWIGDLTPSVAASALSLVGSFDARTLNLSVWSLVHEMRISLVFPLLMWIVTRRTWKANLILAFLLSFLSGAIRKRFFHSEVRTDILYTLHFTSFFILGYILAANARSSTAWIRRAPTTWKIMLPLVGVLLYTYNFWLLPDLAAIHFPHLSDWVIAAGSVLLIVSSLAHVGISGLLRAPAALYLGRISYSLYLYHVLVLVSVFLWFGGAGSVWGPIMLAIPATLTVAAGAYWLVERPSVALGKLLTS